MYRLRAIILWLCLGFFITGQLSLVSARSVKLGIHLMKVEELSLVKPLLKEPRGHSAIFKQDWHYVTVPFTLSDLGQSDRWQKFFNQAKKQRIIPILRLTTRFKQGHWQVPSRKNIVDQINFLSHLNWPTTEKYIIAYNEPNHAAEWGGKVDPQAYAITLAFVADWAHTENNGFVVLPAGLDQAAPNGKKTMEAFNFLNRMWTSDAEVFQKIDVWNAHAYPNPGFIASPYSTSKMSLRSFIYELNWLKQKTGRDFQVAITETGWRDTPLTHWKLTAYYSYALKNIWSDPRVIAVTPFTLKGSPGPFSQFSFLNASGKPTGQYHALQAAIKWVGNLMQADRGQKKDNKG